MSMQLERVINLTLKRVTLKVMTTVVKILRQKFYHLFRTIANKIYFYEIILILCSMLYMHTHHNIVQDLVQLHNWKNLHQSTDCNGTHEYFLGSV